MEIIITDNKFIHEIQDEFHTRFPFLKIEFFRSIQKNGGQTSESRIISGNLTVGAVRFIHTEGSVNIDESRSVEEIEHDFQNTYGLSAEVFRKSGSVWIETSLTDHWSLVRQNYEGEQMS